MVSKNGKINWEKITKPPTKWERFCIWFYWSIGRNLGDIIFFSAMIILVVVCAFEFTIGVIDHNIASEACYSRGGIYANSLCLDPKALK